MDGETKVKDSRSSEGVIIADSGGAGGEDGIRSAGEALGDLDGVVVDGSVDGGKAREERDMEISFRGGRGECEVNLGAFVETVVSGEAESGECLHSGERRVGGWAGSGLDEGHSKRVDVAEVKGGVESTAPRVLVVNSGVDPGLVARLGGEDGSGGGEIGRVLDELGSTEVGGNTNTLEGGGKSGEGLNIGVREVVFAGLGGSGAESTRQESDVGSLVLGDLCEAGADPEVKAGVLESSLVELGESARVEGVLQVLEGERVLEDVGVRGSTLDGGGDDGHRGGEDGESGKERLHCE